jgi:hypothetical protein
MADDGMTSRTAQYSTLSAVGDPRQAFRLAVWIETPASIRENVSGHASNGACATTHNKEAGVMPASLLLR